ncbi:hypothetical protein U0070_020630 [Myodes glareolus]|uniref:Coiled-coil-helix-coiled-coil-helix domain-containing protein 7 n=1 Tax=Myodes glareolus TaxID=447135 RepID=A0AAW0K4V0_MYOGA
MLGPRTTLAEEPDPSSRRHIVSGVPRCRCSRYAIRPARAAEGLQRGVFLLPDLALRPDSEQPRGLDVFSNAPFPHHGSKLRGEWESDIRNSFCCEESDASTRCMDENNYDRERCSNYFLKYKNCRRFWNSVMIQRRQNGVEPSMPTAAERDEILRAMQKMPY